MPNFEEDNYVRSGSFDDRTMESLTGEFRNLRAANMDLFRSFDEEVCGRTGRVNDVSFTVRSIPWIVAGHVRHHVSVLRERYLGEK